MSVLFDKIMRSMFSPGFLSSRNLTLKQASSTVKAVFLHGIVEPNKK